MANDDQKKPDKPSRTPPTSLVKSPGEEKSEMPSYITDLDGKHFIDVLALDAGQPHWLSKKAERSSS